jgi:hypothetical protein
MLRTAFVGVIGAVAAIVFAFLVVAVLSAVGGVTVMYEPTHAEFGWEGAQYGMLLFVGIGIILLGALPFFIRHLIEWIVHFHVPHNFLLSLHSCLLIPFGFIDRLGSA